MMMMINNEDNNNEQEEDDDDRKNQRFSFFIRPGPSGNSESKHTKDSKIPEPDSCLNSAFLDVVDSNNSCDKVDDENHDNSDHLDDGESEDEDIVEKIQFDSNNHRNNDEQSSEEDGWTEDRPRHETALEIFHQYQPKFNRQEFDRFDLFEPPPECPEFYPREEEFAEGPLSYIYKIRHLAEPFGIVKIIPPASFKPEFSADWDNFKFTRRIQHICEHEITTRSYLFFLERLEQFWRLQGVSLKLSYIQNRIIPIYDLYKLVQKLGGFEMCVKSKKWSRVALDLNFTSAGSSQLKNYYERFLYPFDVFLSGASSSSVSSDTNGKNKAFESSPIESPTVKTEQHELILISNVPSSSLINDPNTNEKNNASSSNELKRLRVFGAGPKMPGMPSQNRVIRYCSNCDRTTESTLMLTCVDCSRSFHRNCLIPNFLVYPQDEWRCHTCIYKIFQKTDFQYGKFRGFPHSHESVSLREFQAISSEIQNSYFSNISKTELTEQFMEKEFWRIMNEPTSLVYSEYGSDLSTDEFESAFPTSNNAITVEQQVYVNHPWNINNISQAKGSALEFLKQRINGMIAPWLYVGMVFSIFCWHIEDHYTHSINYLHTGATKTWYGIPGSSARHFEQALKELGTDYESQEGYLQMLVTTCNPTPLRKLGVPIYRTNQRAGQFVVTFPRAYHAGFNQGFNVAEAVNFATAHWLTEGRLAIASYIEQKRKPVFSQDELVFNIAQRYKQITLDVMLLAVHIDFAKFLYQEKRNLGEVLRVGVTKRKRRRLDLLPFNQRLCPVCQRALFLSAVHCDCEENKHKFFCTDHVFEVCCKCPIRNISYLYLFTLEEVEKVFEPLRSEAYNRRISA